MLQVRVRVRVGVRVRISLSRFGMSSCLELSRLRIRMSSFVEFSSFYSSDLEISCFSLVIKNFLVLF